LLFGSCQVSHKKAPLTSIFFYNENDILSKQRFTTKVLTNQTTDLLIYFTFSPCPSRVFLSLNVQEIQEGLGGQDGHPPPYDDIVDCLSFSPPESDIGEENTYNSSDIKSIKLEENTFVSRTLSFLALHIINEMMEGMVERLVKYCTC